MIGVGNQDEAERDAADVRRPDLLGIHLCKERVHDGPETQRCGLVGRRSFMLGVHLFAFMTLEEGALQNAKVAREEDVEVGNGRRRCYVIEAVDAASTAP